MQRCRVLLVDDETVFTKNMSKLLKNRGYQVTAVNSGTQRSESSSRADSTSWYWISRCRA